MTAKPQRQYRHTHLNLKNSLLVALAAAAGALLIWQEGYLPALRWPFAVYSVFVAAIVVWVGLFDITTRRLVALLIVSGAMGLATQWVGAGQNRFWVYPSSYYFTAPMFMFASVCAYGVTVSFLVPLLRRRGVHGTLGVWHALAYSALLLGVIAVDARGPELTAPTWFWGYYAALAVALAVVAYLSDAATVLALFVAAVVVGLLSESLGASSGLWQFGASHPLPPAFLLFGSWPLEVAAHWGLSAVLAREPMLPRRRHFLEDATYEPHTDHPMWTGGSKSRVVVVEGDDKFALLVEALEKSGLEDRLERRSKELETPREALRIAIKPNFMFMYSDKDRSTFTDPALVEYLIDWLRERGFREIDVVEAQSAYGNFFYDRQVENVARVVGYRPNGRYRIVDLTLDKEAHEFSGPLGKHSVGKAWKDAQFRISFAKNKTHTWAWYTLTLKNIYGALPEQNKIREYHYLREIYAPTIDLLVDFPVHFGLVDAFESADGPFGIFADREPNPTRTILAGENLLAVDWVGATKMGLDPMVSRYMQLAVQAFGKPDVDVDGSLAVYTPWRNVTKGVIDFWDTAEESYGFTNSVFLLLNREYMSHEFRRRPLTRLLRLLLPLVAPLGGLVYQDVHRERGVGEVGRERGDRS